MLYTITTKGPKVSMFRYTGMDTGDARNTGLSAFKLGDKVMRVPSLERGTVTASYPSAGIYTVRFDDGSEATLERDELTRAAW